MNLAGESSENQSLKSKINQLESQIEYNLQGLFERILPFLNGQYHVDGKLLTFDNRNNF